MKVKHTGKELDWIEYMPNMFFYKDSEGTVWQLIRTSFKEMPVSAISVDRMEGRDEKG